MDVLDYTSILHFSDLLNYLAENFLCYLDIQALSLADPNIRKFLNKKHYDAQHVVLKRLTKIFGINDAIELNKNLHKYKCYISGSFIVQCVLDEYWINTDIDIYKQLEDNNDPLDPGIFCDDFTSIQCSYGLQYDFSGSAYKELPVNTDHYKHKLTATEVDLVSVWKPNPKSNMSYKTILEFIDHMFDIDAIKVAYDGNKIYIRHFYDLATKNTTANISAYNYMKNVCDEHYEYLIDQVLWRIKKYTFRGFTIKENFDVEFEKLYKTLCEERESKLNSKTRKIKNDF